MTTNFQTFTQITASGETLADTISFAATKRFVAALFQPRVVTPEEYERMMSATNRREEARRRVDALLR